MKRRLVWVRREDWESEKVRIRAGVTLALGNLFLIVWIANESHYEAVLQDSRQNYNELF